MEDINDYNEEPVHYCTECLSLRIKKVNDLPDLDFCDSCGSTNIEQTHISIWEKLHVKKYGFSHLNKHL